MRVSDFSFDLPTELIARFPKTDRTGSRLMLLDGNSGEIADLGFKDILAQLNAGDLLVFNNTRVIPARMFGQKSTGGNVAELVERLLDKNTVLAHIRSSKSPKVGAEILLEETVKATMVARHCALFALKFESETSLLSILDDIGHHQ